MKLLRMASVAAGLLTLLAWTGCGDTFRPVVNPIVGPGGNPQNIRLAVVVNEGVPLSSGNCADGSAPPCVGATEQIDVSGDTNVGNRVVGRAPVHAAFVSGMFELLVANRDDNSVTEYVPVVNTGSPVTISLPSGAAPVFVAGIKNTGYVVNSGLNSVSVIVSVAVGVSANIPVGANPTAIAGTADGSKAYVTNRGDNTVTAISTVDNTPVATIPVGTAPVYVAANSVLSAVYVLNQGSANVSVIDPSSDTVTSTVSLPGASGSNYLAYDSHLQRLYVTNPGSNSVSVLDVSQPVPVLLKTVTDARLTNPVAVAPLPDGSRAYVVSGGSTTGCSGEADTGRVLEIDTASNSVTRCINVGPDPVWIAAAGDSRKVYAPHQGVRLNADGTVAVPKGTSIIATATDQTTVELGAAFADPTCTVDSATCPRMNPVFVIASQ